MERTQAYGVGVGTLLFWTGICHQVVGVLLAGDVALAVLRDGYVGAIGGDTTRMVMFWYFVGGFLMLFAARALTWLERARTLPAELGWSLLAIGLLGGLALPVSGFWLVVPQGVLVLARARRTREVLPSARPMNAGRAAF